MPALAYASKQLFPTTPAFHSLAHLVSFATDSKNKEPNTEIWKKQTERIMDEICSQFQKYNRLCHYECK